MRNNGIVWGLIVLGVLLLIGLIGGVQLNNSIAAVDQRSKALEARLAEDGGEAALTALRQRQDDLEAKIASMAPADLTPLQSALDELRTGLSALESRIDTSTAAGIETLSGRLAALESTVGALPAPVDLAPVTASLDALRGDLDGLDAQLGDLTPAALAELAGRIGTVEASVASIAPTDLTPLNNNVVGLTTDVAALSTEVGGLSTEVGGLTAEIGGLTTRVDQVESSVAAISVPSLQPIEDRLTALESRIGAIQTPDLTPIETEIASIQSGLTGLRTDLDGKATPADVSAVSDQLTALSTRVDALPTIDVEPLRSQVAALETGLAGVRAAVTQLQSAPAPAAPALVALESIYFEPASTAVGDEQGKIDALAARLGANPGMLSIVGFSDSSGPAELNRALSLRRAAAVRLALIGAGVAPSAVTSVTGLGEDAPPVSTDDDTDEAGNRVVVIYGRQ